MMTTEQFVVGGLLILVDTYLLFKAGIRRKVLDLLVAIIVMAFSIPCYAIMITTKDLLQQRYEQGVQKGLDSNINLKYVKIDSVYKLK